MARRSKEDTEEPLIIDRAAAAEIPSPEAVREWGHGKRAFISSMMADLPKERQVAAAAVRAANAVPVMFEQFGGRDADPEDAYLGEVEASDIYIGILGRRYGKPLPTRYSATHAEYLHAETSGLRMAVWCLRADDREGHEQSFLDEIRTFHVVPEFTSPDDLGAQIADRLKAIAAEDLAPWCKLGTIVFRAAEISDGGHEIHVSARVRSDEVAHGLEAFRPERTGHGCEARFTWAGRSKFVRVVSMKSTTTSARSKTFQIALEIRDQQRDNILEMSVSGYSADDLTEAALRSALFGERHPLADQHMGFVTEMRDPLAPLRTTRVPDEIARPLAELLIADEMIGSGRAARLTEFRLGASVRGVRRLAVGWEPPRRYSNERPAARKVDGRVRL
jgi:hypothetical protein